MSSAALLQYGFQRLRHLDLHLPENSVTPELEEVIEKYALRGGKRFRPLLCFVFADLLDCRSEKLEPMARLAELTHAATLIHDDVMDESDFRRGKPSLRLKIGNKKAVLAGDTLIARIMQEMARLNEPTLLSDLAQAVDDLTRGEWLQLENQFQHQIQKQSIQKVADLKTGSLIRFCCLIAARLQKIPEPGVQLLKDFALELGRLFQMTDDRLDFISEESSGKPKFSDLRSGITNSILFYLKTKDETLRKEFEKGWPEDWDRLASITQNSFEDFSQEIENLIEIQNQKLLESLKQLKKSSFFIPEHQAWEVLFDLAKDVRGRDR